MRPARAFLLLAAASLTLGCTEPLAPAPELSSTAPAEAVAHASRGDRDDIDESDHDENGHDDNGQGDRFQKIDIHAVNVTIKAMVFNTIVIDEYSFHVKGRPGAMKGRFNLYQLRTTEDGESEAVVIASGRMICGTIVGDKARTAGEITETSFSEGLPVGQELIWTVTDKGRGEKAPDRASQPLGIPPGVGQVYCAAGGPAPEQLLEKGQIKIRR